MHVGIIKFSIRLPGNDSLKGKRRVVSSLCQKLRNRFSVSVSEVGSHDDLKTAIIGISLVSNSSQIINQVMSQILSYLQDNAGDFILVNYHQDIIAGF